MRSSLCVCLGLLALACFGEAPPIDAPTATDVPSSSTSGSGSSAGDSSDSTATVGTTTADATGGDAYCTAHGDALQCDDFESGDHDGDWQTSIGGADALDVIEPGRDSERSAIFSLGGSLSGVATLHIDHGSDAVVHTFAINIVEGCEAPIPGIVLASFAMVGGEIETARLELVLLPGAKLGLRRRLDLPEMPGGTIDAPPPGSWATLEFETRLTPMGFEATVSSETDVVTQDFIGLGAGNGRRSKLGLESPDAAATCSVLIDDVLIVAASG